MTPIADPFRYSFDYQRLDDGWFHAAPFQTLYCLVPEKVQIEPVIRDDYQSRGAEALIHGPMIGGKWQFFTGLLPTCAHGFTRGDHARFHKGQKVKSLLIVNQPDDEFLKVIYYPNFWISDVTELDDFVCSQVDQFRFTQSDR